METLITLLFLINLVREIPLIENAELNQRAEIRAEQLCKDKIRHGTEISHRNWEDSFEGLSELHGENLAWDWNTDTDAFIALMNSQGHRTNIMAEWFTQVGIGRAEKCNLIVTLFLE